MRPYTRYSYAATLRSAALALFFGLMMVVSLTVSAASGTLISKTFTRIPGGDNFAHRALVQPDGKMIVVGAARFGTMQFQITRYNADGTLDTAFGNGGTVLEPLGPGNGEAWGVALQADGKIVVGGHVKSDREKFGIARFNPDGTLDTTFGGGGAATSIGTGDAAAFAMTMQSDGKILLAGYSLGATGKKVLTVARYNTNATLDTSFGSGGVAVAPEGTGDEIGHAIGIQSNGSIVVAGSGTTYVAFRRFTSAGALDGTWTTTKVTTVLGGNDMVVQPDDKVVVAASVADGGIRDIALLRMTAAGAVDTTFGPGTCAFGACPGVAYTSVGTDGFGYGVVMQSNGNLVVSGNTVLGSGDGAFAIARFTSAGAVDTTFGVSGKASFTNHSGESGFGLALRGTGGFIVAGLTSVQTVLGGTNVGQSYDSMAVAFTAAGALDTTFNGSGFAQLDVGSITAEATGSALQADGKLVVAGFAIAEDHNNTGNPPRGGVLARYLVNGTLDATFGTGGVTTFNWPAKAVALQGSSIVVGGYSGTTHSMTFGRFLASGAVDTSFGTNGVTVIAPATSDEEINAVAVQGDNKIVGAGVQQTGTFTDSVFVRLTSTGAIDASFNGSGKSVVAMSTGADQVNALAIQPSDGKIVGAGFGEVAGGSDNFMATRLNTDGTVDTAFGSGGTATVSIINGHISHAFGIALQGDGKIVLGGMVFGTNSTDDFAVARLLANGTLDGSFGTGGVASNDFGNHNRIFSLALLPSGKLVGAGEDGGDFAVVQYLANGTVDTAFGTGGNSAIVMNAGADFANAISVGGDGTLYVSGSGSGLFALALVTGDGTVVTPDSADVSITQSATPNPGFTGKDLVFALTVANNGPASATNVTVTDTVPSGSTYVWASPSCSVAGSAITCNVGTLASGTSTSLKVVVRPTAAGSVTHTATVSASQPDAITGNNTTSLPVTVNASPAATQVLRYRLYNDGTKEHLYTTDLNEYTVLGTEGWSQEGTVGKVLSNPGSFNGVTATPYYRLYNTSTQWHHWTTDANEYYTLIQFSNWNAEGVDGWILPTAATGATQLYRLNYPPLPGLHHWTIDANEYNTLINQFGWVGEGGTGFVIIQ